MGAVTFSVNPPKDDICPKAGPEELAWKGGYVKARCEQECRWPHRSRGDDATTILVLHLGHTEGLVNKMHTLITNWNYTIVYTLIYTLITNVQLEFNP